MRKTLTLTLLAASTLVAGSSSTLCSAEESVNTPTVASHAAALPQSQQREMDHTQQVDGDEQIQSKTEEDPVRVDESAGEQTEEQPKEAVAAAIPLPVENAPSPSQRGMRQQIKEAQHNPTPITTGQ
jgi:hypothetical protein